MLYLIGGLAKSGKTYAAKMILKEKGIPFFSTDLLMWSMADFGSYNHDDPDAIVSIKLKPYLIRMISFLVKYEGDYVIEGTHITPSLVIELEKEYHSLVRYCFLGYSSVDINKKYQEILENEAIDGNKWYEAITKEKFISLLNEKKEESSLLKKECEINSLKYFDITDISKQSSTIINYLFR